ncbi:hypothetical protein [Clostridium sp. AF02-29]|uniref:hypothetical protein n=1 Tax=Clostridium sp. AF02-29 TaxID=2292993 RepID=UPI0023534D73|nr:hypothetical protein [Clostridium sp. AF02-29]
MKKEFQYMNRDEKIKLLQKTAESFVDKESYTRQKFIGLFDFKNYTMRSENVLSKCKEVLAEKILSLNPDYTLESEEVQEHINDSIEEFVIWVKCRNLDGEITWDELVDHIEAIPWGETKFGIRIRRFGSVYYELHFNYVDDCDEHYLKFYNAVYPDKKEKPYKEDEILIETASYVGISSTDIASIHMSSADLLYDVGLRDYTITYSNGEHVFLRFSEEN